MGRAGSGAGHSVTGVRAKPRGRTRKVRAKTKTTRGQVRGAVLGSASAGQQPGEESVTRPLDFQPRYPPAKTNKKLEFWVGFVGYLIFLLLFLAVTVFRRNSDVYNFSEMVKQIVMTEHFLLIGADTDYFEWLSLHFLPGLATVSYMAAPDSNFKMVGAPRIRQVRAVPCEPNPDFDRDGDGWTDEIATDEIVSATFHRRKIVPACWKNDEETGSTESFGGPDDSLFVYQDAAELGERPYYSSEGGLWLPGGGFVVPLDMMKRLMVGATGRPEEAATVEVPVTEFYGFSYTGYNVSALQDNGWWDARTTAIFHDFTIAASNGMYSHCRLILTVGNNHGLIHPSIEMNMMWLESLGHRNVTLDIVFFIYVIVLLLGEIQEFYAIYQNPDGFEKEYITEQRYRLYQKFQEYAAFYGIAKYDPHPYMKKLMHRLHVKYQDDSSGNQPSAAHIERMNKIAEAMVQVHEDWKGMIDVGTRKVESNLSDLVADEKGQRYAALATIQLFDRVQDLYANKLKIQHMKHLKDKLHLCSMQQVWVRFPIAFRTFYSNKWNLVDSLNYVLFVWAMSYRIHSLDLVPDVISQINDLNSDTMHMKYINFSELAYSDQKQYNINAFNAVLTWIKIFKYLDFYPPMLVLTNTLSRAATMLGSLTATIGIVLLGSGQGFFMAFGLEVHMFRDFGASVMGLLRMAVGDFDYTELEYSNRTLGPLMFWLYILLVFFVLMSMFIALVSEAFEEAKDAQQKHGHRLHGYAYRKLRTPKLLEEAGDRWRFAGPDNTGIISKAMHQALREFSDRPPEDEGQSNTALSLFLEHHRRLAEADIVPGDEMKNFRRRRGSVSQINLHSTTSVPVNPTQLVSAAESGFESTWLGKKWRARMYWSTGCDVIKTAGNKREVPGWFKTVEAKRKGVEYVPIRARDAQDPRELSFEKSDTIIVTEQPPGGHKHPRQGIRKEGVWKGYVKRLGPASVKIVYGFDTPDEEGRYTKGGDLKEKPREIDKLADAVDLSDDEDDMLPPVADAHSSADVVEQGSAHSDEELTAEGSVEDVLEHAGYLYSDDDNSSAGEQGAAPENMSNNPVKISQRDTARPLSMAQPDPAYHATGPGSGKSFGETRQHEQTRKEKELEKRLVEQDRELRKLRKENEAFKVQSLSRREAQLAHSNGTSTAGLEARVDAIAEALHGTIPAAIAASTEALRTELDEIKGLLLGSEGGKRLQALSGAAGVGASAARGSALSTDRALSNREDGKWVKMANIEGSASYGDAEEYWHHTGTNAIRKSPPPGVQAYDDAGEPVEIDGAAMRWDDESHDSMLSDVYTYPPGQLVDPISQSRLREKQRKKAQARERSRKAGEPGSVYGMRSTPASMALESDGMSRPMQLHVTASKIAGGTTR